VVREIEKGGSKATKEDQRVGVGKNTEISAYK
jgi:hypothetical protein